MYVPKNRSYRKTKEYKLIKEILYNNYCKAQFIDTIPTGVSFKWFYWGIEPATRARMVDINNLRSKLPKHLSDRVSVKFLDIHQKEISLSKNWIEEIFGKKYDERDIHSLRILVNLRGV